MTIYLFMCSSILCHIFVIYDEMCCWYVCRFFSHIYRWGLIKLDTNICWYMVMCLSYQLSSICQRQRSQVKVTLSFGVYLSKMLNAGLICSQATFQAKSSLLNVDDEVFSINLNQTGSIANLIAGILTIISPFDSFFIYQRQAFVCSV